MATNHNQSPVFCQGGPRDDRNGGNACREEWGWIHRIPGRVFPLLEDSEGGVPRCQDEATGELTGVVFRVCTRYVPWNVSGRVLTPLQRALEQTEWNIFGQMSWY